MRRFRWWVHTTCHVSKPRRSPVRALCVAAACAAALAPSTPQTGRLRGARHHHRPGQQGAPFGRLRRPPRRQGCGGSRDRTDQRRRLHAGHAPAGDVAADPGPHRPGERNLRAARRRHHARVHGRFPERRSFLSRRVLAVAKRHVRPGVVPSRTDQVAPVPQGRAVKVYCHIHSHMSASIMVFDHPFFTIPKADGSFTIDDVPTGHLQGQRLARADRRKQPVGPDRSRPALRSPVRAADKYQVMAARTPRFVTRTMATTFATVVFILAAVLLVVTLIVRERMRTTVIDHLTRSRECSARSSSAGCRRCRRRRRCWRNRPPSRRRWTPITRSRA